MGSGFGDLPDGLDRYEGARIVILPIPFGLTASWIKGTEFGPRAIIDASANLELYDIETDSEVCRLGIHTDHPIETASPEEVVEKTCRRTRELLDHGKFVVAVGGEHSVSLGVIRAHLERYPEMSVLHLDAHGDTRQEYEGSRLSHACVMARVREMTEAVVSVGIRSMDAAERGVLSRDRVFFAHDIISSGSWMPHVVERLSPDVYITCDLDVFDPGIMPSTGTPEPGGLDWYQVTGLFREVARERNIVGFDIVELCPGENRAPDFLAAKLIYKLLSYKFPQKHMP